MASSLADLFVVYKNLEVPERRTGTSKLLKSIEDYEKNRQRARSFMKDNRDKKTSDEEEQRSSSGGVGNETEERELVTHFTFHTDKSKKSGSTSNKSASSGSNASLADIVGDDFSKYMQDMFKRNGINATITSGKRKPNEAGNAGEKSKHVIGEAIDIIPGEGSDFETLRSQLLASQEIRDFFQKYGIGVIDETDPEVRKRTGGRGDHYHIGTDNMAKETWNNWIRTGQDGGTLDERMRDWTKDINERYVTALKNKYGGKYDNDTYQRLAYWMTCQSALESGYGQQSKGYNYGGHKRDGKTIEYDSPESYVTAHLNTLDKWDYQNSHNLREYVEALNKGEYKYNPDESVDEYYDKINGTTRRVASYLNMSMELGGKFAYVRQKSRKYINLNWR